MEIFSTYSVKIKHYNHIFKETVSLYRKAVDFYIHVCLEHWDILFQEKNTVKRVNILEHFTHKTKKNPMVQYPSFDQKFYKFPCYLRRSAISEAIGKVSSYKSNLANWEKEPVQTRGRQPSFPKAGYVYPALYRTNMYLQTGAYEVKIKVFTRNTWDWLTVHVRRSDMDYIQKHCQNRQQCSPTLQKRGHQWFLDFPFEESVTLSNTDISDQTIVAVDLGILSAATVSVIRSDGTILGRHFCQLPREYDSLNHAVNRIKKAQQYGNRKTPRLWARVKGINDAISVKTAHFIIDVALRYHADVIVFEHLNLSHKKRGSKKQSLHLWKSRYVQSMVTGKAHRQGIRIAHVNAWGTSRFAFDGSGTVARGKEAGFQSYSLCRFKNGKIYNCDLSASYNIGSRYFIREILKSLPEKERLVLEANVPQVAKRSTCTFSTFLNLNAELQALRA